MPSYPILEQGPLTKPEGRWFVNYQAMGDGINVRYITPQEIGGTVIIQKKEQDVPPEAIGTMKTQNKQTILCLSAAELARIKTWAASITSEDSRLIAY